MFCRILAYLFFVLFSTKWNKQSCNLVPTHDWCTAPLLLMQRPIGKHSVTLSTPDHSLIMKLTDGQSNLLFSNQAHALDGAIGGVIFP